MTAPKVGQIVYYGTSYERVKFYPAIITYVRDNDKVDLTVFHSDTPPTMARNIPHSSYVQSGMWSWPEENSGGK